MTDNRPPLTLNVAECARATGLTPKAIRRRIERGTLESALVAGQRRIPLNALIAAGLLVEGVDRGHRGAPQGTQQPGALVQRLIAHRERLAEELSVANEFEAEVRRLADQLRRERLRTRELEPELERRRARIARLERTLHGPPDRDR
jgi:hypothetical protein